MRKKYDELKRETMRVTHEEVVDMQKVKSHDEHRCKKGGIDFESKGLMMDVYEWPLPSNNAECLAAVVELALPPCFAIWRDITYEIQSLGRPLVNVSQPPEKTLLNYAALYEFQKITWSPQITLASKVKSLADSHYHKRHVNEGSKAFSVPCGLRFESYQLTEQRWLSTDCKLDMRSKFDYCYNLTPNEVMVKRDWNQYRSLHGFTQTTKHATNNIVSDQSTCSTALTLHEFEAYGRLRSGISIQWLNISRELTQPNLT